MELAMRERYTLPLALKVFLVLFSCVLAVYNTVMHGASSLLYICNLALFLATFGICSERSLPVSMAAVGVVLVQLIWSADLLSGLFGRPLLGMATYMLTDSLPVAKRGLSLFHAWLPPVLVYAVWRLGYDRRAFLAWTVLTWIVLIASYVFVPPPPAPASDPLTTVNVNYVFGLRASGPQQRMPGWVWLGGMMTVLPLVLFYPSHRLFARLFSKTSTR
jgi:hypothetical protein